MLGQIGPISRRASCGTARRLQGHRSRHLRRPGRPRGAATQRSCRARPASRRCRSTRRATRPARRRQVTRRSPATSCRPRSTSASSARATSRCDEAISVARAGTRPAARAARSSRWTPTPAACSRSARCRPTTRTCSSRRRATPRVRRGRCDSGALDDLAIDGLFPTGSTFKPITALAGAEGRADHGARRRRARGRLRDDQHRAVLQLRAQRLRRPSTSSAALTGLRGHLLLHGRRGRERRDRQRPRDPGRGARSWASGESPGIDLPGGGAPGMVPDRARDRRHQPAIRRRSTACPARRAEADLRDTRSSRSHAAPRATSTRLDGRPERRARDRPGLPARRARCRWRSPTRRSSTAARSGGRRSPRRSSRRPAQLVAAAAGAGRRRHVAIDPLRPAAGHRGPARRRAGRRGHLGRGLRQLPLPRLRQDRHGGRTTARPTSPGTSSTSPTARRPIVIAVTDRAGRLRRRGCGTGRAADALAVVRAARSSSYPDRARTADGHARRSSSPAEGRDPAALAPRVPRAWLDPLLLLAALGLCALSRWWCSTSPARHSQMVRQGAYFGVGIVLMLAARALRLLAPARAQVGALRDPDRRRSWW